MRFLLVVRENYSASLESYKGLIEIQARHGLDEYERLVDSHITIDGQPAVLLCYRGILRKAGNLPLQFLVTLIPVGNTITGSLPGLLNRSSMRASPHLKKSLTRTTPLWRTRRKNDGS